MQRKRQAVWRTLVPALVCAGIALAVTLFPTTSRAEIPPVPEDKHYILDEANIVSFDAADHIGQIQKRAAEEFNTQIVVVTIDSMAEYGAGHRSIEGFAREWFDEWGIGIRKNGKLYNKGILLLVSRDDRKARIELGAEWGHRWDGYCQRVMQETIVPSFKQAEYSQGIIRGVDALASMAERGPQASPPERALADVWISQAKKWTSKTSFFAGPMQLFLIVIGLIMVIGSFFLKDPQTSRYVFWGGIALIVFAVLSYVVLVAIAAIFGDGEEGYSGGGGFGGGFSGGGGATGSW